MPERFKVCRTLTDRMVWLSHVGVSATLSEIRVAIVLADCCNSKTGLAFPSQSLIAKRYQMQRPNVAKAIGMLRDKNLIYRVGSCGQVAQWKLILPLEPASTEKLVDGQPVSPGIQVPVSPGILVEPRDIITVVKPGKIKPKTQSPTLHGAGAKNPTPGNLEGWRPDKPGKDYFFKYSGLTTEEDFAMEVEAFIHFNLAKHTARRFLPTRWRSWVKQIPAYKIEQQKKRRNGDSAPPTLADDVKRVTKPVERCWQQFDKNFDPTKDRARFISMGCSRIGACDCKPERRKAILEELDR